MARTILEIYDEMIAEKQTLDALNGLLPEMDSSTNLLTNLTTGSKVAAWRLLFFVVSVSIWVHEKLFDKHVAEIEARANELITGVPLWYRDQCFLFQYGYALTWNGKKYQYLTVDDAAQIIERAAVIEAGGQVRIKVAKLVSDLPAPLSSDELDAFKIYMNQIKFAGTNIAIISREADLLKISFDIFYNPLVMNAAGELITDPSIKPVENAINNYIQNLPFNGVLNLTKLTDAVQLAEGVIDPILTTASAKYGALSYTAINRVYNAYAGHMKIDPIFPLTTQINYFPNV